MRCLDYTLNSVFTGVLKGIVVGFPARLIFRSPTLGYFIIGFSIGMSLQKSNSYLIENLQDV